MLSSPATHDEATPPVFRDDDERWEAVRRRDAGADGQFVFSVRTTGVYCRPSCPSRRARRENVAFHASTQEAEAAGFRPCKRCCPNGAGGGKRHVAAVTRACRMIQAREEPPDLATLARVAGMSRYHFHRVFRAVAGVTPKAYAQAHRTRRLREELEQNEVIADTVYAAGFHSTHGFYTHAKKRLGMTPTARRNRGEGTVIRFAVGESSLGAVLVAATERGICAIRFGDAPGSLVQDFQEDFSRARLIGGDEEFERLIAVVVGLVEAPGKGADLPLDVRGTAFQEQVWRALQRIPAGSTATYGEIAATIGRPGAARAVARACASNNLAVAIPCHRVVRSDGAVSGYRWGVERKRVLLEREGAL